MRALLVAAALVSACGCTASHLTASQPGALPATARPIRVLLTNDDGIDAPGIVALRQELARRPELYDVTVVAPASDRSGSGMSRSFGDVALVQRGPKSYAVFGTPADCVVAALGGVLSRPPDIVVSGMNRGANLGRVALLSGTVGAAMTAASAGSPAIAVSIGVPRNAETPEPVADAAAFTLRLIRAVVLRPDLLPPGRILSVNYPALPRSRIRGVKVTSQAAAFPSARTYRLRAAPALRPGMRRFVLIRTGSVGVADRGTEEQDVRAYEAGWVTVTPMDGDWTCERALPPLNDSIRGLLSYEPPR